MTLSEFVTVLNNNLGYLIDSDPLTKRKSNALVLKGFLLNFISADNPNSEDDPDLYPLSQTDDFLGRIYTGTKQIPFDDANSILNRLDSGAFYDFVCSKAEPDKTTIEKLKNFFLLYGEKIDVDDYCYSLMIILKKILVERINTDDHSKMKNDQAMRLLLEVNQECPLHKFHTKKVPLLKTYHDANINKFRAKPEFTIINIYPAGLKPMDSIKFDAIQKKPSQPNDDSNKLCVCCKCASKYTLKPNPKDYEYLINVKRNITSSTIIEETANQVTLEDDINEILNGLVNVQLSKDNIEELRMKPLTLANKIYDENIDLKQHLTDNLPYYHYIRKLLQSLDDKQSVFETIAMEVSLCFKKISKINSEQTNIYVGIINWILEKSGKDMNKFRPAADKIASFFVQNCEVFDEISK